MRIYPVNVSAGCTVLYLTSAHGPIGKPCDLEKPVLPHPFGRIARGPPGMMVAFAFAKAHFMARRSKSDLV